MVKLEKLKSNVVNPNQRQQLTDYARIKIKLQHLNEDGLLTKNPGQQHEKEVDARILDSYDSFYRTTKSLLVLFQIMGVVPISRSTSKQSGHRTTFSWTSKHSCWAYFIYSVESIVVIAVFRARIIAFVHSTDQRFDMIVYHIIFISILLLHFLLPFGSWRHGAHVAEFKNMWTDYQVQHVRVIGHPVEFTTAHSRGTWAICIIAWCASIAFVLAQYYLQPDFLFWHTFAYYHIIATLNCFCGLWYINCEAFTFVSKLVIKNLLHAITPHGSAYKTAAYRNLWIDLSRMMGQLAIVNSSIYSLYLMMIFFTTIIASYGSLSEIIDHGFTFKEIGLIMIVFYCMSILFIICNQAHHATTVVGYNFQEFLFNVNLMGVSEPIKKEIEMFLIAIQKNPPVMNLNGYTDVNRGLITSSIAFICTYLLVLMQFKMSLVASVST